MNSLLEALRIALRALTVNKVRSSLTMLGIIIGVTAVIALVSIGQGFSSYITNQFSNLGTNMLTVSRNRQVDNPQPLTIADANALKDPLAVPGAKAVAPVYQSAAPVAYAIQKTTTEIAGVTPEYQDVRAYLLKTGRFVSEDDVNSRQRVAVLGATVAEALFPGSAYPIGETIRINDVPFEIIGVLDSKGGAGPMNNDDFIFVPLSTAQTRLFSVSTVRGEPIISNINIEARSKEEMDSTQADITAVLRQRHRIGAGETDDFNVFNQADLLATATNVTGTLTLFLGAIAAISLLVGGIGIMNIMLVSVTERTREIGLRKAIGAARSDVLLQFLIEAMILSLIGGLVGVGLGALASRLIGPALNVPTTVTPQSIALAVGFSGMVGIVFGIYPALRASGLNPIEALRYE